MVIQDEECSYVRYLAVESRWHKKGYGRVKHVNDYRAPSGGLMHPLWDQTDPIEIGETLFRGTTSRFVRHNKLLTHEHDRIYFSEGEEDAEGYACIGADWYGGEPVLAEVELTQDLADRLKPGMEGLGEWFVEAVEVPVKIKKLHHPKCEGY
jgi:hypothetical protein